MLFRLIITVLSPLIASCSSLKNIDEVKEKLFIKMPEPHRGEWPRGKANARHGRYLRNAYG